jgi:uncharacterized protein DUF6484
MSNQGRLLELDSIGEVSAARDLEHLLAQPVDHRQSPRLPERIEGIVVGTLVAFVDHCQPLVIYPGQSGTAALVARSNVDLCAEHIGHEVTLMFENADPQRPIVMGRIRVPTGSSMTERPPHIDIDADGQRLIVLAKEQIVFRCGRASITLTKTGKVIVQGTYISNRSSGVLRLKGGSVQIN